MTRGALDESTGSAPFVVRLGIASLAAAFAIAACAPTSVRPKTSLLLSPSATSSLSEAPSPMSTSSQTPTMPSPVGASFWDAKRGLLIAVPGCSAGGAACTGGVIERTADGGRTWQSVDRVVASLTAVAVAGSQVGWVSETAPGCGAGGLCQASILLVTADGGAIWTTVASHTPVGSVSPVSATSAWAVAGIAGATPTGAALVRSDDGGRTWKTRGDPCSQTPGVTAWVVNFAGPLDGWLVCTGGPATDMQPKALLSSKDGGVTWHLESDACLSSPTGQLVTGLGTLPCVGDGPEVARRPDGRGWMWASRGWLAATLNDGRTWVTIAANLVGGDVNEVVSASFVDDSDGFILISNSQEHPACPAVGCGPELLATSDAGRSWRLVDAWAS
jgi:hypothetical protein